MVQFSRINLWLGVKTTIIYKLVCNDISVLSKYINNIILSPGVEYNDR